MKHDWDKLKQEWLQSDFVSINQFREFKKIDTAHFSRHVSSDDWYHSRGEIAKKALEKIKNKMATKFANRYSDYTVLWDKVKKQAGKMMDGRGLRPNDLRNLTESIERALKSERLINDQSTENVNTNVNVVDFIRKEMGGKDE